MPLMTDRGNRGPRSSKMPLSTYNSRRPKRSTTVVGRKVASGCAANSLSCTLCFRVVPHLMSVLHVSCCSRAQSEPSFTPLWAPVGSRGSRGLGRPTAVRARCTAQLSASQFLCAPASAHLCCARLVHGCARLCSAFAALSLVA